MKLTDYGRWTYVQITEPRKKTITIRGHLSPQEIRQKYPSTCRYAYVVHGLANYHNMVPVIYVQSLPKL